MNDFEQYRHRLHNLKRSPYFRILIAEIRALHAFFTLLLTISPRRLFLIAVTFSPEALTIIFHYLSFILPPLTIFFLSLAVYTPYTLITILDATTTPLLATAATFYLAYFLRRGQAWAPRIFSPIPWASLRLALLAILTANLALSLPFTLPALFLSITSMTAALVLMHYTTFILAADIFVPRRIRLV